MCPRWLTPDDSQKGLPVLYLDSGTAFGTGQHETTSMCIKLIDEADVCGQEVLDVGCGSGILGLSALLKGASRAVFTDIDSQATEATLENARLNGLEDRCEIICGDLAKDVKGRFPVVFANLTADILYLLAEGIGSVTLPGGRLVLSGILNDRADKVEQAFAVRDLPGSKVLRRANGQPFCLNVYESDTKIFCAARRTAGRHSQRHKRISPYGKSLANESG